MHFYCSYSVTSAFLAARKHSEQTSLSHSVCALLHQTALSSKFSNVPFSNTAIMKNRICILLTVWVTMKYKLLLLIVLGTFPLKQKSRKLFRSSGWYKMVWNLLKHIMMLFFYVRQIMAFSCLRFLWKFRSLFFRVGQTWKISYFGKEQTSRLHSSMKTALIYRYLLISAVEALSSSEAGYWYGCQHASTK